MSLKKSLNNIVESDLLELINNSIPESKTIDYKKEIIGDTRDDKKEFLADVSSFANAIGGFIVFGMNEEKGVATELIGLNNIDPDAEILRLENIIRDGIEPRIFGISIKSLKLSNSNYSIIIYIPNSWAKPHVVNFSKHWRFYSRNS
ncbi:MAG: ATP-binding protein, partial [Ignavibacteria bacterium]|nr:ATP-binding protein [Ignavibacteria bacterium]